MSDGVIAAIRRRLSELERKALSAIADLTSLDGRLDTAESDITALEAADTALDGRLDALESLTTPGTWTAVTFAGTWTDYGGGYQQAQYRKVGDLVQVRGVIKDGTIGTTAFTLPAGHRPPGNLQFAQESALAYGMVEVQASGAVIAVVGNNSAINVNLSFSIT